MDDVSDKLVNPSAAVERSLIDSAWAQFETLASRHKPSLTDGRRSLVIPGYRILCEIHRGGQGVVYQAVQESTHRKVAIKVLKEGPFADPTELARFDREVDVLSRLNHPHIVAIHDRGLTEEHAYYVMDYIPGRTLDAYVAGAALSSRDILDLCRKVCEAVNIAHLRGVIHRDLKPSNIRIDDEGEPHVLDFGLAKLAPDASWSADAMTVTGQFIGSLPWASPEQAEGRSELLDVRTDVYSLGVILYQLLTGSFPYPVSGRMNDVVNSIVHTSPARPSTLVRNLDRDVEVILLKCLAKDPERRYQSAGELARDIQRYLTGEPIEARPATSLYQLRQFARRNKTLVTSVIAVIIILAGATVVSVVFAMREAAAREHERSALAREVDQRQRADREAAESNHQAEAAQLAQSLAEKRAEETKQVADFQAGILRGLDAEAVGRGIRDRFRQTLHTSLEHQPVGEWPNRRQRTPTEIDVELSSFDRLAGFVQTADVARGVLDEFLLASTEQSLEKTFVGQPMVQAKIRDSLGAAYRALGLYDLAEVQYRLALETRRRELGFETAEVAVSLNAVATVLYDNGQFGAAESLCREAMAIQQKVLEPEHRDLATTLNNLGIVLHQIGDLGAAERLYRDALAMRRKLLGEDDGDVAMTLNSLGALMWARGDLGAAEGHIREALAIQKTRLGDSNPDTLTTMMDLAVLLGTKGEFDGAVALNRETLLIARRRLGNDHPKVATILNNLALQLKRKGELPDAEALYREALVVRRKTLGSEHPDVANSLNNLAVLLRDRNDYPEAELFYREAIAIQERAFPPGHEITANSRVGLGRTLLRTISDPGLAPNQRDARLSEAESLLLGADESLRQNPTPNPLFVRRCLETLVELYELRHASEPGKGHDTTAAQWRAKLQHVATSPAPQP